tara:strand:- start:18 stop:677 length:660 start_codon:yes stop_codon:yes gene_type:complete
MLKNSNTYEIMTPESIGLSSSELVLGKHSGRHAFKVKLEALGYSLIDEELNYIFKRFKDLADKKKQIFEEDLIALLDEKSNLKDNTIKFLNLDVKCGNKNKAKAVITLVILGEEKSSESSGQGPIDAIFNSIKKLIPNKSQLILYQVNAITKGIDAQAEVSVRLEESGVTVLGQGKDIDTMVASAKSYVNALNKLINKRDKFLSTNLKRGNETFDKHAI